MSSRDPKHDPREGAQGESPGAASAVDLPEICLTFRSEVIDGGAPRDGEPSAHGATCRSCQRWVYGVRVVAQSLGTSQLCAPGILAHRVAIELEEPAAHLARAFGRLEPRKAPAELDQAVEHLFSPLRNAPDLEAWELESPTTKSLRDFRPQPTPPVLDRLVEEEVQGSAGALASRYIGRLSHLTAPDELARRLTAACSNEGDDEGELAGAKSARMPALRGRSLTPIFGGLLAAAALLMIVVLQREASHSGFGHGSAWDFEVVLIEDAGDLDPQAAAMLSALMGASLPGELGHSGEAQ